MSIRYFRVFSGLLSPDHRKRMGSSIWTFLWLIDHITDETIDEDTGQRVGYVHYGNPKSYEEIAKELGYGKTAIAEHCEKLFNKGYISIETTTRGNIFTVLNSKKWNNPPENRSENQSMRSEIQRDRSEKRTLDEQDRTENQTNRSEKSADRTEKQSDRPFLPPSILNKEINKDKLKEITTTVTHDESIQSKIECMNNDRDLSDYERLENRYIELRAKGVTISHTDIQSIRETVDEVPYEPAAHFLAECFEKRSNINSFRYCQKYIVSEYKKYCDRQKAIEEEQSKKVVPFQQPAFYDDSSDELKLANLLVKMIVKDQGDFTKPDMQKWASAFNSMLIDGKSARHIQEAIVFARKTVFWKTKILSPADLKRNYDRLRAQAQAEQAPNAGKRNQRVADMPKWMAEDQEQKTSDVELSSNDDGQAELQALLAERQRRKEEKVQKNGSYGS